MEFILNMTNFILKMADLQTEDVRLAHWPGFAILSCGHRYALDFTANLD